MAAKRVRTYVALCLVLLAGHPVVRALHWSGSPEFHTVLETIAAVLALLVGAISLVHHHVWRGRVLLFMGAGFLGTGVLDAFHGLATSGWITASWASAPALFPWSWQSSRLFLATLLFFSWFTWQLEARRGERIKWLGEGTVYIVGALAILGSVAFFLFVTLPPAYFPNSVIGRPAEIVPALLFLAAFVGYWQKGTWRTEIVKHWLMVTLIISIFAQVGYMTFSRQLFDGMFDAAHVLKITSYVALFIGLGHSVLHSFQQLDRSTKELGVEVARRRATGRELRKLARSLEAKVEQRTRDLREQREAALNIAEDAEHARRLLAEGEARVQAIIDNAPAVIQVKDIQGRYILVNREFERLFRLDRAAVLGTADVDHGAAGLFDGALVHERRAIETRTAVRVEDRVFQDNGEHIYLSVRFPLFGADGEVYATAGISTDITELQRTREELRRYAANLERSNRDLQQFAYVASHDLQEPLRMVASYTQLLARRYRGRLDADADDFIHFAVDGAQRMQALINDLLTYSRIDTQGRAFEPVDVGAVLNDVRTDLAPALESTGGVLLYDDLPTVTADPSQIRQLMQNLVGNALKFASDAPPEVRVSATRNGGDWCFAVQDNGIGIPRDESDRIFTIFQRLHTRSEYPGTGIGLAVCKRVVERRGGRIWVESQPGAGSTFYFTIPDGTDKGAPYDDSSGGQPNRHSAGGG